MRKEIIIAGAGLVGSLLSIYLVRRGYEVVIYEKRPDMRKVNTDAGRSINLALSDRGILALQHAGLGEALNDILIPMAGRSIHNPDGSNVFQPYGKQGQYINSVSRATLNARLIDQAEKLGVTIHFEHKCKSIDWKTHSLLLESPDGKSQTRNFDLLFGADGAYSEIRRQCQQHLSSFDEDLAYIDCGYKELTIPPTAMGEYALPPNALHIWPRREFMLIALPNLDRSFTCTLFLPMQGQHSFAALDNPSRVRSFFEDNFRDAIQLMPGYVEAFSRNPASSLFTLKCFPWTDQQRLLLIGDAAHAIVPFFGQGMNTGFEDCRVLDGLIETYNDDWPSIFDAFQSQRKPDTDAIADLAIGNYNEMREKTADRKFLLQKKIEAWLHERHPDQWIPAYSQVTFSPHTRFSEALRNASKQEAIMQDIMHLPGIEDNWQTPEIEHMILGRL
jgi:kynurenine 3-monooxygenase